MNQTASIRPHRLTRRQQAYLKLKYAADFLLSALALVVLAVPMALLMILIKIDDPGPIFFRQERIGMNQKTFHMLKFRTMKSETPRDMPTHLLKNPEQYITRVGRVLRKSSLDELPQILNILMGHMSIVGPRPALWNQFDLIEER